MTRRLAATSFIGREEDLHALADLFATGERLVTILGPGGMGKTRLARRFIETRPAARSVFCDLVDATSVTDICVIACTNLGVPTSSPDAVDQLASVLASRGRITLVLDNVEQLVGEMQDAVARLLDAAPDARFLLTSRVSLRMPEEVAYELGPLSLPTGADALESSEAGKLWAERARRARRGYSLEHEDKAALRELLAKLDGNPLAIELAASRVRVLSPAAILERLGDRLAVLRADGRVWDDRHRALGSVIETSWEALTASEKMALAELTVFPSMFTAEAAEAVVSAGEQTVTDVLQSLREQSLLTAHAHGALAMYETVRAFASTKLADRVATEERHARFFGERALRALSVVVESAAQRQALEAEIDADRASYLAVAERGLGPDSAVLCLAALDVLHPARDPGARYVQLAQSVAKTVLEQDPDSLAAAVAGTLLAQACRRSGAYAEAEGLLTRALSVATAHRVETLVSDIRVARASIRFLQGALDSVEEELARVIAAPPLATRARAWLAMGQLRQSQSRFDEARAWLERAVSGLEAATPTEHAFGLLCLFEVYLELGAGDLARDALERAKSIETRIGDRRLSVMVRNMESWRLLLEDPAAAAASYQRAIDLAPTGADVLSPHLLGWQGLAYFVTGRYGDASVALERAVGNVAAKGPLAIFVAFLDASRSMIDRTAPPPATAPWNKLLSAFVRMETTTGAEMAQAVELAETVLSETEAEPGSLVRLMRALLGSSVRKRAALPMRIRMDRGGESFSRAPGRVVRLRGQVLLKSLLVTLARAHARSESVSIPDLFATGWPGEKASAVSVEERVRAAIKRLRRAGLEDLIEAHEGGFRFAPGTEIELE